MSRRCVEGLSSSANSLQCMTYSGSRFRCREPTYTTAPPFDSHLGCTSFNRAFSLCSRTQEKTNTHTTLHKPTKINHVHKLGAPLSVLFVWNISKQVQNIASTLILRPRCSWSTCSIVALQTWKPESWHSSLPYVSYSLHQAPFLPCASSQFTVFTCIMCTF